MEGSRRLGFGEEVEVEWGIVADGNGERRKRREECPYSAEGSDKVAFLPAAILFFFSRFFFLNCLEKRFVLARVFFKGKLDGALCINGKQYHLGLQMVK
jgi:hypothetical protein